MSDSRVRDFDIDEFQVIYGHSVFFEMVERAFAVFILDTQHRVTENVSGVLIEFLYAFVSDGVADQRTKMIHHVLNVIVDGVPLILLIFVKPDKVFHPNFSVHQILRLEEENTFRKSDSRMYLRYTVSSRRLSASRNPPTVIDIVSCDFDIDEFQVIYGHSVFFEMVERAFAVFILGIPNTVSRRMSVAFWINSCTPLFLMVLPIRERR